METKIAYFREKLGMTQERLAELTDVTRQTIISLEKNRYNPSLALAHKITRILERKSIEDVFIMK